jgi:hypothetical protein
VLLLSYLMIFAFVGFMAYLILGLVSSDTEQITLGAVLAPFFLMGAIGMEFYARRYVFALDHREKEIVVSTKSLLQTKVQGAVSSIGQEISEEVYSANNVHHRLVVKPSGKTLILDVTEDDTIAPKIRKILRN